MKTASAQLTSALDGSCGRLPITTTSITRIAVVIAMVTHHTVGETFMKSSGAGCHPIGSTNNAPEVSSAQCRAGYAGARARDDDVTVGEYSPPRVQYLIAPSARVRGAWRT